MSHSLERWRSSTLNAHAQTAGTGRFKAVDPQQRRARTKLPPGLDSTPVTVVVLLPGDPVAVVQETAGRRLSRGEKDSVKSQRKNEQNAVSSQIVAAGGKIVGTFQSAINGIKVQIPSNKIGALRQIPGVVDVKGVNTYERDNVIGVPRVQAPAVWAGIPAFRGEGMKIAIIDTGIDYTHANFGGPGTVAAFDAAFAASTSPADPALFGPARTQSQGRYRSCRRRLQRQLIRLTPIPASRSESARLQTGHGSHVAGTAAGFGVKSDGTTYHGPYDATTYTNSFRIGPGVAPKADLYAVRVFGCDGSTDVVVDALDWAVDHDMDVVNMSLGSDYGTSDSADALASDNAVKAGVVVVASAGNANDLRYITGHAGLEQPFHLGGGDRNHRHGSLGNFALPAAAGDPAQDHRRDQRQRGHLHQPFQWHREGRAGCPPATTR